MSTQPIDFFPVVVTDRPSDLPPFPFDPSALRITRAADVAAGDLVLGWFMPLPNGRQVADYHADAYAARPVPNNPNCLCPGHASLSDEVTAGGLTILTTDYPWDACDVMPSDALVMTISV